MDSLEMIVHTCTLRIETKDTATAVFMDIAVLVLTAFEERRQCRQLCVGTKWTTDSSNYSVIYCQKVTFCCIIHFLGILSQYDIHFPLSLLYIQNSSLSIYEFYFYVL